jgi:hypothetical protein
MQRMQRLSMGTTGEEEPGPPAQADTTPSHVRDVGNETPSIRVSCSSLCHAFIVLLLLPRRREFHGLVLPTILTCQVRTKNVLILPPHHKLLSAEQYHSQLLSSAIPWRWGSQNHSYILTRKNMLKKQRSEPHHEDPAVESRSQEISHSMPSPAAASSPSTSQSLKRTPGRARKYEKWQSFRGKKKLV